MWKIGYNIFVTVTTVEIVNSSITVGEGNSARVCVEKSGQVAEAFSVIINPSVFSPPEATREFFFTYIRQYHYASFYSKC